STKTVVGGRLLADRWVRRTLRPAIDAMGFDVGEHAAGQDRRDLAGVAVANRVANGRTRDFGQDRARGVGRNYTRATEDDGGRQLHHTVEPLPPWTFEQDVRAEHEPQ